MLHLQNIVGILNRQIIILFKDFLVSMINYNLRHVPLLTCKKSEYNSESSRTFFFQLFRFSTIKTIHIYRRINYKIPLLLSYMITAFWIQRIFDDLHWFWKKVVLWGRAFCFICEGVGIQRQRKKIYNKVR